jgi:glycosyltransferase involved in cell wall biosynthesis
MLIAPLSKMGTSKIFHDRDLICFSHDWSGDPLSKTHLMRLLAVDNRVLWINSIGYRAPTASKKDLSRAFRKLSSAMQPIIEAEKNLFVLSPIAIPSYGRPLIRALNRKLLQFQVRRALRKLGFERPINWVFNPAAGVVAGSLGEESIIYYCVDEYSAFSGVSPESLASLEAELIGRADLVIVSSERLFQAKAPLHPRTYLVRHGVDFDHFRKALDPNLPVAAQTVGLPGPIVGYFGLMAEDWIDLPLLEAVAGHLERRGGSLVLVGQATMDLGTLPDRPNVVLTGRRPYSELPAFCKAFDAAIIPFPISECTLNANPLKAREYLAAGLPVVSTAIPEVEVLGLCRIGRDLPGFLAELDASLLDPGPKAWRSDTVSGESWRARLDEIALRFAVAKGDRE